MEFFFTSELDWDSRIVSIAKTVSKKIGAFTCFVKLLSSEAALYLYKSTIPPCMECYHALSGAPRN